MTDKQEGHVGWAYWLHDHWHLCAEEPTAHEHRHQVVLDSVLWERDAEIVQLQAELLARKLLTEGLQGLLAAYRTHGHPSQKTMRLIAKAKKDLAALGEASQ